MICLCPGFGCEDAKPYYYDVLSPQDKQAIPESVVEHIQSCTQCQESIVQLERILNEASQSSLQENDQPDVLIASLLELHLSYLDHEVTCATAKPFLPTLADDALKIWVKTPITEHVKACQACQEDVQSLRILDLSSKQFYRLGQFLADRPTSEEAKKKITPETVDALAFFKTEAISSVDIRQVLKFPSARQAIQERRTEHVARLGAMATSEKWICEEIQKHHLFFLALAYTSTDLDEMELCEFQDLQDHVRSCSHCLNELQDLNRILFGIADRANSKTVTLMTTESMEGPDRSFSSEHRGGGLTRILHSRYWRSGIGTVAASIVLVLVLFTMMRESTAVAVDYQAMISALDDVLFMKMIRTTADPNEVIETIVYDQQAERYLIQQRATETYWGLADKRFLQRASDTGQVLSRSIPTDVLARARQRFETFNGFLPSRGDIPAGSQWNSVQEDFIDGRGVEIHELLIPANLESEGDWVRRLVYVLDLETNRPLRMESYQRLSQSDEFHLESVTEVTYPGPNQIRDDFLAFMSLVKDSRPDMTE